MLLLLFLSLLLHLPGRHDQKDHGRGRGGGRASAQQRNQAATQNRVRADQVIQRAFDWNTARRTGYTTQGRNMSTSENQVVRRALDQSYQRRLGQARGGPGLPSRVFPRGRWR